MTDDIAAIAAGLTGQQRDALRHLSEEPWKFPHRWQVLIGFSLEALSLSKRTWLMGKSYITPLGIAVRRHLQGLHNDHP